MDLLRTAVVLAFALLAVSAARLWWQRRTTPAAWLLTAFGVLALGLVLSWLGQFAPSWLQLVLQRCSRATTVAFPYLLLRFTVSLFRASRLLKVTSGALATALVVASLALPTPPADDRPAWYLAFVVVALAAWSWFTTWVVWRVWRASQGGQPTVARSRLRMLGSAAATLNLALVVAGLSSTAGSPPGVVAVIQGMALVSAVLFQVAFAPPAFVRSAWRMADERALWRAEYQLIASTSKPEVVDAMLPHISHLLGGPAMFIGRSGREYEEGDVPAALREQMRAMALEPNAPAIVDRFVLLQLRNGRLGVSATTFTPLFGEDEIEFASWLGTLVDLALERVALHDGERVARTRAEQLSAELEALVFGLTHDLRNPIVAVLGYVDCLSEDYGPGLDEEGRRFLDRLRTNAEYMDRLISDLLELSRVGRVPEAQELVDLHGVAESVAEELRGAYPSASIVVESLPHVTISPSRARQLLTNLITNALVHSGRPDVTVTVRAVDCTEPGQECITVTDDGRGVPGPYRAKVFGLFERLDHTHKEKDNGTGIGLAMCQRIVAQAGGRIWIADSEAGTDVRIQLPVAPLDGVTVHEEARG